MSLFLCLVHISENGKFPIHSVFKLVVKLLHRSKYKQEKTGKLLSTEISAQSQWNAYEGMLNKLNGISLHHEHFQNFSNSYFSDTNGKLILFYSFPPNVPFPYPLKWFSEVFRGSQYGLF